MTNKHVFKNSSSLAHCDYDDENKILTLCFKSGSTHNYHGVEKEIYEEMKNCNSAGKFYHSFIRGKYKESKV
jgi:putative heme iron utilization protein